MSPPVPKPLGPEVPPSLDPETTLDLIKALENAAIVIDEVPPSAASREPEPSFNPYDRAPVSPGRKGGKT